MHHLLEPAAPCAGAVVDPDWDEFLGVECFLVRVGRTKQRDLTLVHISQVSCLIPLKAQVSAQHF